MQPEDNGSMPVAAAEEFSNPPRRRPLLLRNVMFQACIQNKSLQTTRGEIQDVLDRAGGSAADLADLLSKAVGKRIADDGTMLSAPDAGNLVVLDRDSMAAMGSEEQEQCKKQQKEVLVQYLAGVVRISVDYHSLTSASGGDDAVAASTVGRRVRQWVGSLVRDAFDAFTLDLDKYVCPKSTIGIFDIVCCPFMVAQCVEAILDCASSDGSAMLLHRHGKGKGTFEGFCCEEVPALTVGRDASQLLRVVSSKSLDLLLATMVSAEAATLLCRGTVVALGGAIDEEGLSLFKLAAEEEEGSSNPPPPEIDDVLLQACLNHETLVPFFEQIKRALGRAGGNVADLSDMLSSKVGKRIKSDGAVAPTRGGGDLVVLDGVQVMAGMAATGPNLQQDMLVQLLAALMAPNRGNRNRNRNRLGALLGSASAGDDDPAPLGKRVLQFIGGVANDFLEDFALDMDKHVRTAPVDPAIGIFDAICSPVMVMECINAILVSAARHGSAVLLHRRDDGENTFESFCRDAVPVSADLEPSQLLRVVESSSLDLLLDVMVRADLATLHDNGEVVAIGGPVDEIRIREFERLPSNHTRIGGGRERLSNDSDSEEE